MNDKDRVFIEALFVKQSERFEQRLDEFRADVTNQLGEFRTEITQQVGDVRGYVTQQLREIRAELRQQLGEIRAEVRQQLDDVRADFRQQLGDVRDDFKQHVSKVSENFDTKISKLAEGHQAVVERLDGIEASLEEVNTKVDRIELRLIAHMSDVEAHHGVYRVREEALEYAAEIERQAAKRSAKNVEEESVTE